MSREVAHSLEHFDEVIHIIDNARSRAMKAVNAELIQMYWEIGSYVSGRVKDGGWGKAWLPISLSFCKRIIRGQGDFLRRTSGV